MNAIAAHLWQCTLFVCIAALLALFLRRDSAALRFWIWFAASLKFLVPFAVLSWLGNQFVLQVDDESGFLPAVRQATAPLTAVSIGNVSAIAAMAITIAWALVAIALLLKLLSGWLRSRALVHSSLPVGIDAPVEIRCSLAVAEPCVVGIIRPALLLPSTILESLTSAQLDAVIAHEMCHVRRRDNLISCLHSVTQALFWFHPLVWWIGAQLLREREYACDEAVLEVGYEPGAYATALLNVCRHSMERATICQAHAVGGVLSQRIRAILTYRSRSSRHSLYQFVVAAVLLACMALPIASGVTVIATSTMTPAAGAHSIRLTAVSGRALIVMNDSYIYGRSVSLRELIGRAFAVRPADVIGGTDALDSPRYDIELSAPRGAAADQRQLLASLLERRFNLKLVIPGAETAGL